MVAKINRKNKTRKHFCRNKCYPNLKQGLNSIKKHKNSPPSIGFFRKSPYIRPLLIVAFILT